MEKNETLVLCLIDPKETANPMEGLFCMRNFMLCGGCSYKLLIVDPWKEPFQSLKAYFTAMLLEIPLSSGSRSTVKR